MDNLFFVLAVAKRHLTKVQIDFNANNFLIFTQSEDHSLQIIEKLAECGIKGSTTRVDELCRLTKRKFLLPAVFCQF